MQDFSKKIVIVVNRDLPFWQVLNTVAHISAFIGNKMDAPFDTGSSFLTNEGKEHPRNSQFPIIVLSAKPGQMVNIMAKVRSSGLLYLGFIREMIETTDDAEIVQLLSQKNDGQIEYLGVGVFGENEQVDAITKNYSLWK